jgi:hypothetical protein
LLPVSDVGKRLRRIFPDGSPHRTYCIREMAARTVFVMLYVGAIQGRDRYLRPDQVTRMTDRQAARKAEGDRAAWARKSLQEGTAPMRSRWYAANTREPIRDETLRGGLVPTGAVVTRTDLPTTSPQPRYALAEDFAALFDPALSGDALERAIKTWQASHLSAGALARVQLVQRGAIAGREGILVKFPNEETRRLSAGPSSVICKAVVEEFAPRFLGQPAVLFLSESGNKVVARDEALASSIGLRFPPDRLLPDVVLVDLAPAEPLLVFVEAVATDGAVSAARKSALLRLATDAGFAAAQLGFLTAYGERSQSAFRKSVSDLAWGSFAWFASEPDHIVQLRDGADLRGRRLSDLL